MPEKQFVTIAMPPFGVKNTLEQILLTVRDNDGEAVWEGPIVLQGAATNHGVTAVMSLETAGTLFVAMAEHSGILSSIEETTRKISEQATTVWTEDTERNVRDRARAYASTIFKFKNCPEEDFHQNEWENYRRSLMNEFREPAETSFLERMIELNTNGEK